MHTHAHGHGANTHLTARRSPRLTSQNLLESLLESPGHFTLPSTAELASLAPPMEAQRRTGWVTHERYYWHDSGLEGPGSPHMQPRPSSETPESKRRLANLVAACALGDALTPLRPRPATPAEVLLVHSPAYLAQMQAASASAAGGYVGHELHLGPRGYDIAALSCGGVLAAVEAVLAGAVHNAYALVRPPGHHAERDRGHGFCAIDNVAVAAEVALRPPHSLARVAIVDIDVHHGNGPEQAFYERADVLYVSLHQDGLYPLDTGAASASGAGAGAGYNVNCPLPPGCGIGAYRAAFERVVEPALRAFRPELILVSCGFDAAFLDPLGRMLLTAADFGELTRRLRVCAEELCGGRLVYCHEGGYSEV
jgi:acetoin utilization deacetylase AcuC-like enzyme